MAAGFFIAHVQRVLIAVWLGLAAGAACAWAGSPGAAEPRIVVDAHGAEAQSGALRLRITALADDLLRVRVAPLGEYPEDASWVVPQSLRQQTAQVQTFDSAQSAGFRTARLEVRIERPSLRVVISDLAGHVLSADAPLSPAEYASSAFTLHKLLGETEHVYGLGDKTGPLDRRGGDFVDWNTDAFGFQESTDPIYKSVPFFVVTGGAGGSYGLLLDNTWRSWFDFGKRDAGLLSFGAPAGPIDYYFVYGPTVARVVQRYTDLSGRAPLPPLWSLGFQQSRYSYMSAAEVRSVARRLRAERLPADVIWLDIDYQDRNRPFTTNPRTFPDLPGLARELRQTGIRLVAITDLHVAAAAGQGYAPYDSGMAGDHFLRRADGALYVAKVWPGDSVFPEFTAARSREWWGGLYAGFIRDGISGFWNDMNEPAIFDVASKTMPLDNLHRIDEPGFAARTATHAEIHNVYGMLNSRATFEGMQELAPTERPYVMTRASFAGGQRYAATWTGDNGSSWNHLHLSIAQLLNLGLSGFAYSGIDVGGYHGVPNADLMTRWMEVAAFMPVFRAHSENSGYRKEPWVDGPQHTAIRRRFIEARYRLLPYLYALADENARTGAPLMRPLFYDYPEPLPFNCELSNTFTLGSRLLIAPPGQFESPQAYDICLPAGRWYDYWSGLEVSSPQHANAPAASGGALIIQTHPSLASLPVYVRGGTILPRQPLVQSTAETPRGPLYLEVYPGPGCTGTLYADDGHSTGYQRGEFLRQSLTCSEDASGLTLHFDRREGSFRPWWRQLEIRVHGWPRAAGRVVADQPAAADIRVERLVPSSTR